MDRSDATAQRERRLGRRHPVPRFLRRKRATPAGSASDLVRLIECAERIHIIAFLLRVLRRRCDAARIDVQATEALMLPEDHRLGSACTATLLHIPRLKPVTVEIRSRKKSK
jgi:hypothetical protein